jgi:deoxyhypusine synthase
LSNVFFIEALDLPKKRNAYFFKQNQGNKIMKPVEHIKIKKDMKVSELVREMKKTGFGAKKIGEASEIMNKMFNDKQCTVFLGLAGAMVPAGMKEIIMDVLDNVNVFVSTGANLTHDLIEALGENHYQGDDLTDDSTLNKEGIDRIYNVFMKNAVYEKLEDFFEKNFNQLKDCRTIKELLWKIGELAPGRGILKKCFEKKIPIFCPGIADSGIGLMMWGRIASNRGKTNIDVFEDMKEIIDISWTAKKRGVIYLGGGLHKNFIQQSLQFSKGADYGIQITTDRTEPGGSSGAPLREGISWGKMKKNAEFVDVFCDTTIALPLIFAGIKE